MQNEIEGLNEIIHAKDKKINERERLIIEEASRMEDTKNEQIRLHIHIDKSAEEVRALQKHAQLNTKLT